MTLLRPNRDIEKPDRCRGHILQHYRWTCRCLDDMSVRTCTLIHLHVPQKGNAESSASYSSRHTAGHTVNFPSCFCLNTINIMVYPPYSVARAGFTDRCGWTMLDGPDKKAYTLVIQ